jgi:ABC-type transporter Mla maintaining outer membrane lipid asymmetry ATPase subunit MlaF
MSENQNPPAIEMRGASVGSIHDVTIMTVEDVNWSVAAGEFWVVAGQQQSGKSDFLMLAAGLMTPLAGSCKLFGTETQNFGEAELPERLRIGFVFEGGQLFNQLTIAENIALPLRYHKGFEPDVTVAEVKPLLDLMELTPLADVTPANVAANWRQRAALARALVLKPELLLLDNPQAGLVGRQVNWTVRFLDRLARGHEYFGGKPMTIVATADDLRPWTTATQSRAGAPRENARRKFTLVRDKKFISLGTWNEVVSSSDDVVKELLAEPMEATI